MLLGHREESTISDKARAHCIVSSSPRGLIRICFCAPTGARIHSARPRLYMTLLVLYLMLVLKFWLRVRCCRHVSGFVGARSPWPCAAASGWLGGGGGRSIGVCWAHGWAMCSTTLTLSSHSQRREELGRGGARRASGATTAVHDSYLCDGARHDAALCSNPCPCWHGAGAS